MRRVTQLCLVAALAALLAPAVASAAPRMYVGFHDDGERLPPADDVLAKWMTLRGIEYDLISEANLNRPGHQVDPDHARRDIARLRELGC